MTEVSLPGPKGLVIAGNDGGTNVGASLFRAAPALGVDAQLVDTLRAYAAPRLVARFNWWVRGRRPTRLRAFSREVVQACSRLRPRWLVSTGLAPIERSALDEVKKLGVETINYLTDDPWNPACRSTWFFDALVAYDRVFSVRTRNMEDLRQLGCASVTYLPFGVDPALFFPEDPTPDERERYQSDVLFAGGADRDRIPYIAALVKANVVVGLYGDYWERFRETRAVSRGHASPMVLRRAIRSAAVALCLVRRANRDGHSMRSFELPAVGACMVVEDTDEHRALFGPPGDTVIYFSDIADMVQSVQSLLADPERRHRLAEAVHRQAARWDATYRDRLRSMLRIQ